MLAIPRLDLKMPITAVTVDDTGAMAVPTGPLKSAGTRTGRDRAPPADPPSSAVMSTAASTGWDRWSH